MTSAFQFPVPIRRLTTLSIRHFAPPVKNQKTPRSLVAPPHVLPPSKVAIVGGGLAALATAYHLKMSTNRLLRKRGTTQPHVTIITPHPATSGASVAAAGLLHPFTPRVKKLVWKARSGIAAAEHLLTAAQQFSDVPFYRQEGLLRLAMNDKLKSDFIAAANRYPSEVEYLDPPETAYRFPEVNPLPAAFIPKAFVVDTRAYMAALWKACQNLSVRWVPESVDSVKDILGRVDGKYDTVVVCAGAEIRRISEFAHVPVTPCRGQNVLLKTEALQRVPVIAGKYVVPDYFGYGVLAGATFEYVEDQPMDSYLREGGKTNPTRAEEELKDPVERLIPGLFSESHVLGASAGLRALPPRSEAGSVPIASRVSGLDEDVSVWVLTGLGSRGLLHHGYLGRMMAHAVVAGNERLLPFDARRFDITWGGEQVNRVEDDKVAAASVYSQ